MAPLAVHKPAVETETMRRISLRIMPFLMVSYFIAFVDRVNVGFAGLQMKQDIGLSETIFGLAGFIAVQLIGRGHPRTVAAPGAAE
jgi:sugar phosphate permease